MVIRLFRAIMEGILLNQLFKSFKQSFKLDLVDCLKPKQVIADLVLSHLAPVKHTAVQFLDVLDYAPAVHDIGL